MIHKADLELDDGIIGDAPVMQVLDNITIIEKSVRAYFYRGTPNFVFCVLGAIVPSDRRVAKNFTQLVEPPILVASLTFESAVFLVDVKMPVLGVFAVSTEHATYQQLPVATLKWVQAFIC
jgi:hypothetical protein